MATKKITLNELRSIVKQIIKEDFKHDKNFPHKEIEAKIVLIKKKYNELINEYGKSLENVIAPVLYKLIETAGEGLKTQFIESEVSEEMRYQLSMVDRENSHGFIEFIKFINETLDEYGIFLY